MANNAASAYNDSKVMTATPAELTLMLYEGAIKFCNIAIMAIEKNDMQKANLNIIKAENIILELRSTLDMKYPVSMQLDSIYDFINRNLIEANIKKDKSKIEEVLGLIRELRDTWKEAMKLANSPKVAM
ncbi:MAG: flagellar export chaperone FliS [Clostridiales bacterium]|nr:flagellar export chaperone FliS [Clostridiales bacterium]